MNNYVYKRGYIGERGCWELRLTREKKKDEKNEMEKEVEIIFCRVKEMIIEKSEEGN